MHLTFFSFSFESTLVGFILITNTKVTFVCKPEKGSKAVVNRLNEYYMIVFMRYFNSIAAADAVTSATVEYLF